MYKILLYMFQYLPSSVRKWITRKTSYYLVDQYAMVEMSGVENIPQGEPVIYISNHLSNLDGLLLTKVFQELDKLVYFMAGVKLKGDHLTNLMLEIVPHIEIEPNKPDRKAIKNAVEHLRQGSSILIFPEGTRSRTGSLIKGRSGVVLIAKMAQVPIVPVGITGTEKCLPIDTEGKMSRESLVHSQVTIRFGEPFVLAELEGAGETVDQMMEKIALLLPEDYQGYYRKQEVSI